MRSFRICTTHYVAAGLLCLTGCPTVDLPANLEEANRIYDGDALVGGDAQRLVFRHDDVQFSDFSQVWDALSITEGVGFAKYTTTTFNQVDPDTLAVRAIDLPFTISASVVTDGHWIGVGFDPPTSLLFFDMDTRATVAADRPSFYPTRISQPYVMGVGGLSARVLLINASSNQLVVDLGRVDLAAAAFSPTHAAVLLASARSISGTTIPQFVTGDLLLVALPGGALTTVLEGVRLANTLRISDGVLYWVEGSTSGMLAVGTVNLADGQRSTPLQVAPLRGYGLRSVIDVGPHGVLARTHDYDSQSLRLELFRPAGDRTLLYEVRFQDAAGVGQAQLAGQYVIYSHPADQTWIRVNADGSQPTPVSPAP